MAFHPYPQLIPPVFNLGGFGPPHALTRASTWPWVDHPASGPERATTIALFGLALATATPHGLTSRHATDSQAHSSKGTPSPHKALTAYKHTVSGTISLPSRGTFHHSLTVLCTIGHSVVFRLTRWSWQIHTRFHESRTTREHNPHNMSPAGLHDYHALRSPIPRGSTTNNTPCPPPAEGRRSCPTTPRTQRPPPITRTRFSLLRFRSPLLTEYLFLRVLRCFTSPRSPHNPISFRQW